MKNNNFKFALFGHGLHMCNIIEEIIKRGFPKPVIITHPKELHQRDKKLLNDQSLHKYLFDTIKQYDLKFIESSTVNNDTVYKFLSDNECNIGFSVSCRSIIQKYIIDFFDGRIFNIHPSYLPHERGSGTFSWRILNNSNEVSATIHHIDEGIDTGNVVMQKQSVINKEFPTPYDFFIKTGKIYTELINGFLANINTISESTGTAQSKSEGSYFPRLITEENGIIDWTIDGVLVERVIRAFSYPYPGASTYLNGFKVSVLQAIFQKYDHDLHPMLYGRIIHFSESGVGKIVVKGGFLLIDKVKNQKGELCKILELISRPGQFSTPVLDIEDARSKNSPISKLVN